MPQNRKKLPPDVIDHWPEVFEDIEISIVPLEYLHSVRVGFSDGKIWDIAVKNNSDNGVEDLQEALDGLFDEYQDVIESVDFRLDTDKVKRDITQRTKRFLKLRR